MSIKIQNIPNPTGIRMFTIPSGPPFSAVSLLINAETGIVDVTGKNTLSPSGVTRNSTIKKFGTHSLQFVAGTNISIASSGQSLVIGTGDFTYEMWINPISISTTQILHLGPANVANPQFMVNNGAPTIIFNNAAQALAPTISVNQWSHIAFVRHNGVIRVYSNGIGGTPVANTTNITANGPLVIGTTPAGNQQFLGYIDDMRFVKGIAVYTSNFTPPTTAFPVA